MTRAKRAAAARNAIRQFEIDLGLAVSACSLAAGQRRTAEALAAFCNCSKQAIEQTEYKALRKFREAAPRHGLTPADLEDLPTSPDPDQALAWFAPPDHGSPLPATCPLPHHAAGQVPS
jgi:hypothetical protein